MPSLYSVAGTNENIEKGVKKGVSLGEFQIGDEALKKKLQESYPEGKVYLWGLKRDKNVIKLWEGIKSGDYIIFYNKDTKKLPYLSKVLFRYPFDRDNNEQLSEAEKIARSIWGTDVWSLLLFLEPGFRRDINLDLDKFKDITDLEAGAPPPREPTDRPKFFLHLTQKIPRPIAKELLGFLGLDVENDFTPSFPAPKLPQPEPKKDLLDRINEIIKIVEKSKQVILLGPPGSGKTYIAMWIAHKLTAEEGRSGHWLLVQFHRSYKYDDFIERMILKSRDNNLKLTTEPQIFVQLCKYAQKYPGKNIVLVIDEINRADIASVFGELLYALEYRGRPVRLPYSGEYLVVPENLYIIATANDIDRGTFDIGVAIRRRFEIIRIDTSEKDLNKMLQDQGTPKSVISDAIDIFNKVNELFENYMGKKGIGHLFFKDVRNEEDLARVWENRIKPLIEDYFLTSSIIGEEALNTIKEIDKKMKEMKSETKSSP